MNDRNRSSLRCVGGVLLVGAILAACSSSPSAVADAGTDVGDIGADGADTSADTADDTTPDMGGDTGNDTSDDADTDDEGLGLGEFCSDDPECASDVCFLFQSDAPGFCAAYCQDDSGCPSEGFDCVFLANSGGDFARVCVPDDLCVDADGDGYGLGPGCAGPDCDETSEFRSPGADETCDGVDNDCDEQIDENPIDANLACATGFPGVCGDGRLRCAGGALECVATATPGTEFCDALDNNCDGFVDNNTTIGGVPCPTGLPGVCGLGASSCEEGEVTCVATVEAGTLPELCDALDNDCDGEIDEDFDGVGGPCFVGVGACRRAGVSACDPANPSGTAICNATAGTPADAELCNYEDDDCDGEIDEDFLSGTEYATDNACGNCFTDCTEIYARDNAFGVCSLPLAGATCEMICETGYYDLNAVPADGCEFELDGGAIYVSQSETLASDTETCGFGPEATGEGRFPCATIAYGVARALVEGRTRVRVADGAYEETVEVVSGVSLLGGHRTLTWEYAPEATNTAIRGSSTGTDVRTITAVGITTETLVEGFLVYGQNASALGANSYAIYIRDSTSALTIRNNTVFAGAGAQGRAGENGTNGQLGEAGAAGLATRNANCSSVGTVMNAGGAAGARSCQDPATFSASVPDTFTVVSGGAGGAALCPALNAQEGAGATGQNGGGAGGPGGWGHSSTTAGNCSPTADQPETGTPGGNATGANNGGGGGACSGGTGTITAGEWRGGGGAQGGHGNHGRGGGGGGAGSGQQLNGGSNRDIGGSGGGGGSGGCAGEGGYSGSAGGGSFGIFVLWTSPASDPTAVPVLSGNHLTRNRGGAGGAGGSGGAGGDGGAGGAGGPLSGRSGPIYCIFGGALGGFGSRGGHGGGGGGGCGGSSFDIVAWGIGGQPQDYATANTFALPAGTASGGSGGSGGISINTATGIGARGSDGRFGNVEIVN